MQHKIIKLLLISLIITASPCALAHNWLDSIKKSSPTVIGFSAAAILFAGCYLLKKCGPMLMRTRLGFHISHYYNTVKHGADFTCDQITDSHGEISIKYDESGAIQAISDGKKTPVFLSSIPTDTRHIEKVKASKNLNRDGKKIALLTFNEPWERNTSGLSALLKSNQEIYQYRYSTPDYSAPSLIDLIRIVRHLENRDTENYQACVVHCKAGRGRSATGVGAYLAHVIYKQTKKAPTADEIEAYLITRRPQVKLASYQKNALSTFINKLDDAGGFENLYEKHTKSITQRRLDMLPIGS